MREVSSRLYNAGASLFYCKERIDTLCTELPETLFTKVDK